MNTRQRSTRVLAILLPIVAAAILPGVLAGCNEDPPPSLYDPGFTDGLQPVITSVNPTAGLAGVTVLTITGLNFAPDAANNKVYFDATLGTVLQASTTQLIVRPPNVVKDSIRIKVGVPGSTLFSDPPMLCRLDAAFETVSSVGILGQPWGTIADTSGNFYVSISGGGVYRVAPDGATSQWAPPGGPTKWSSLKLGRSDTLYGAPGVRAIFRITQGSAPRFYTPTSAGLGNVNDLDFDEQGFIWAGGSNTAVYRVGPDSNDVKSYQLNAIVRSVRVYNGYVYFAGRSRADSAERVFRYQLTPTNDLGTEEVYFDLTSSPYGGRIFAINFTSQGDLLLGTDNPDPIIIVHPDRSAEPFYPGLFAPTIHILVWGKGTELIAVRGEGTGGAVSTSVEILRINAQVTGAPYHGRN